LWLAFAYLAVGLMIVTKLAGRRLVTRYGTRLAAVVAAVAALTGRGVVPRRERLEEYTAALADIDCPAMRLRVALGLLLCAAPQMLLTPLVLMLHRLCRASWLSRAVFWSVRLLRNVTRIQRGQGWDDRVTVGGTRA
jgi:hypothetical protein